MENKISPDRVVDFFYRTPNPNDDQFHAFAARNNYNVHETEAEAYRLASNYVKFLRNGRANEKNITESSVDPDELKKGIKVEMEHTSDPATAKRIALDHLAEVKHYYTGLDNMEKTLDGAGDSQMAKKLELNCIAKEAFLDELEKISGVARSVGKITGKGLTKGFVKFEKAKKYLKKTKNSFSEGMGEGAFNELIRMAKK